MTIIIPDDYPSKKALEDRRILCIQNANALKQDIRPLRIGILNIMPEAENYEFNLLFPLGRSVLQIQPIWIKLDSHTYASSDSQHLQRHYQRFFDAVEEKHLDGFIISGAPVEQIPFTEVHYWQELQEIMAYARENIVSTLGICWGGMALTKYLGIEKRLYEKKLFGVFETHNIAQNHPITGEMDDIYWCPNSRYAGYEDRDLEHARDAGKIDLLAHSPEAGYLIYESSDHRFLMHLGHFEYNADRLVEEYRRDLEKGVVIDAPLNVDLHHPVNRWRTHNLEFFSEWIRYVYLTTEY
ncbi:homoserine O-acetyltransferase/O-succinyltransferase family protein [Chitinivibrio alkaliphilus]|uniref:Homoserine O-acetyltransferase n=1 Tax=Chitinivibrio alkaliphilus ACht1 TaxID=1313304 RepID=U7DDQ7_9BACT|nr:homoserine O-succinyltransferase [Chitinivibrio alkaliphilus]ERP39031.1 putative Homoserine O-succinyltransferase [Chitinivibrio alkaliphilus ACht1]